MTTYRAVMRGFTVAILSLLFARCEVGHADYAIDLAVDVTITSADNQPIKGAELTLTQNEKALSEWRPICSSDSLGQCAGRQSFRFGRIHYGWRGERRGPTLALLVRAPNFEAEVIPLDKLTREEIAGLRRIVRRIVLRPSS